MIYISFNIYIEAKNIYLFYLLKKIYIYFIQFQFMWIVKINIL